MSYNESTPLSDGSTLRLHELSQALIQLRIARSHLRWIQEAPNGTGLTTRSLKLRVSTSLAHMDDAIRNLEQLPLI